MKQYQKSNELLQRAKKVTPLGTQTYSKSVRYFGEINVPAFIEKGQGCYLWDVDGNKYIDFVCALGPVIIGYNDKRINDAISTQLKKGIIFTQATEIEVKLAEKLVEIVPCAEMVRFVKNGSDATTVAVKLARAYTGRERILMCGYHGMNDWSISTTENCGGIPKSVKKLTSTFLYNNLDSVKEQFLKYSSEIACVILEPIQGNGPNNEFLQELKELAHKYGALLIFDEVVSGFRYALGGGSEYYEVVPDLVCCGKGLANGMPLSFVAGRIDVMQQIETKGIFVSTTFGGETLSIAAALETINILEQDGVYDEIWRLGTMMKQGLELLVNQYQLNDVITIVGLPPHCGPMFEGKGKLDYLDIHSIYQQKMIEKGILTIGINNISVSHSEDEIQQYLIASELAMKDIVRALKHDSLEGVLYSGKVNPIFKRNIK